MKSINVLKIYAVIAAALLAIDTGSAVLIDNTPKTAIVQSVQAEETVSLTTAPLAEISSEPPATPAPSPSKARKHSYSKSEKILIARVVYGESRGEPFEGQVAVATVVINRYESGRFGKTVRNVVYAKNQFAVGSRYNKSSMDAVEKAVAEDKYPHKMFYFQRSKSHHWRNFIYYCRIGHHSFYLGR